MRIALKILGVLVVGVALGLAATWFTVFRGTMAGNVSDGPWKTSLYAGSSEGGPYLRASIAVHGLLALNRHETIYYTAATDSDGAALDGACVYQLRGWAPPARWWSITAYGADDFLIPNPANRYSVSMNSVVLGEHSMAVVTVSKTPATMNWIPVTDGRFNLSIRLYNPDDAVAADPEHVALFDIHKVRCA
jgi:hypothetical protein